MLSLDCTAKVAQDASIKAHQAKGSPVDVRVGSLRVSIPWDGLRYIGKDGSNPPPKKTTVRLSNEKNEEPKSGFRALIYVALMKRGPFALSGKPLIQRS